MNVKPKHYSWPEFYDHVIDLTAHSFSWRSIINRFRATSSSIPKWMNFVRATSSEGFGRLKFYKKVRSLLEDDRSVRDYFEGESTKLPQFYYDIIRRDLRELWDWLPEEAIHHDPYAYLNDHLEKEGKGVDFVSEQAQA